MRKTAALGAILLGIGVFLPALKIKAVTLIGSIKESFSFIGIYNFWGIVLLGIALWVITLSFSEKKSLIAPFLVSLIPIGIVIIDLMAGFKYIRSIREFVSAELFDVKILPWGWAFIAVGEILLLIGALVPGESSSFSSAVPTELPSVRKAPKRKHVQEQKQKQSSLQQVLTQVKETFFAPEVSITLKFLPRDDINSQWRAGIPRELKKKEIKIGRESGWADLRIGRSWQAVSRRHGIIKIERGRVYYFPLSHKYSFAIDGKPMNSIAPIRNGSVLTLVSGYGPEIQIFIEEK